jgi:hypothetical protein
MVDIVEFPLQPTNPSPERASESCQSSSPIRNEFLKNLKGWAVPDLAVRVHSNGTWTPLAESITLQFRTGESQKMRIRAAFRPLEDQ